MAESVRVREISNEEGNRLLRAVRRSSGSVVTWRRSQMVLLSAQGHGPDPDRVGHVHEPGPCSRRDPQLQRRRLRCLYPRYRGGRPPKYSEAERGEIKQIALSRPTDHDLTETQSSAVGLPPSAEQM